MLAAIFILMVGMLVIIVWIINQFLMIRERSAALSSPEVSYRRLRIMEHSILKGLGFRDNINVLGYIGDPIDLAINRGVIPLLEKGERPENSCRAAILLIAVQHEIKNRERWKIECVIMESHSTPTPKSS